MADVQVAEKVATMFARPLSEFEAFLPPTVNANRYLLNGELIEWEGPKEVVKSCVCVTNPETGAVERASLGSIHRIDSVTALRLLDSAFDAYDLGRGQWPRSSVGNRIQATKNFLAKMVAVREDVVRLLMWEIGKNREEAENEFDRTVEYCRETITALRERHNTDSRFVTSQGHVAQIRRLPIGVVLSMGPFNYPLNETFTTLIPAIIMGNTCVVKLPRHGCLSLVPLFKAFAECFPPGVVNIFNGRGADTAGPIIQTGKLTSLAFIGSSTAANTLRIQHPKPNRLRCSLGLDAKNAAIVLGDADLNVALKEVLAGTLAFSGQRCTGIKIVFVHRSIVDVFVAKFAEIVDALKFGLPWEAGVKLCPLPEVNKVQTLQRYVTDAVEKGARVVNKNGGAHNETFFFPAVVYPVDRTMRLWLEEQFGPIVPIVAFDHTEEVIDYIVDSSYGQQVSVFGKDSAVVGPIFDVLVHQVCRVNLNGACKRSPDTFPFTARKDSAEGTLDIESALRAFSIRSMVAGPLTDDNQRIIQSVVTQRTSEFLNTDMLLS